MELIVAARDGNVSEVRRLVARGADVHAGDDDGGHHRRPLPRFTLPFDLNDLATAVGRGWDRGANKGR